MRTRRLSDAAAAGMILSLHCDLCQRTVHYWAADLVKILGPDHPIGRPPWPCAKCKTSDFLNVRCQVMSTSEMQGLTVRRPVRQVVTWIWRNEKA